MRKMIEVVAAVICDGHRIFATQRGYGEHKGKWEFPGGKIEDGETHSQALVREIMEELQTEISLGGKICTIEWDYPRFLLKMHCYCCKVVKGDLHLVEAEDCRWLSHEQLDSLDWLPADMEVVRKYLMPMASDARCDENELNASGESKSR